MLHMVSSHILWPLLGLFMKICKVFLLDLMKNHHHIISIFRLGCCPCPIQWGWQHQAMPNSGSPSISVLCVNPQSGHNHWYQSWHILDRAFLGLPFPLGPGSRRSETDLILDVARCTCRYHLSCPLWRTAVISLMPSFWSSGTDDVSTQSLVPQIQRIMAR